MGKVSSVADLSAELAAKRGMSKTTATDIMKDVINVLSEAIADGGVSIKGVMTIKPKVQKGREGTISFGERKGQKWKSEDKYILSITTGSDMSAKLNK